MCWDKLTVCVCVCDESWFSCARGSHEGLELLTTESDLSYFSDFSNTARVLPDNQTWRQCVNGLSLCEEKGAHRQKLQSRFLLLLFLVCGRIVAPPQTHIFSSGTSGTILLAINFKRQTNLIRLGSSWFLVFICSSQICSVFEVSCLLFLYLLGQIIRWTCTFWSPSFAACDLLLVWFVVTLFKV